jgi:hypothetical protein
MYKPIDQNTVLPEQDSEGLLAYQQMRYIHWCRHMQNQGLLLLQPNEKATPNEDVSHMWCGEGSRM